MTNRRRFLAVVLSALMVLSVLATPGIAGASTGNHAGTTSPSLTDQPTTTDQVHTTAQTQQADSTEKISSYLSAKLATTDSKVSVLVVFDTQPSEKFNLGQLSGESARQKMRTLARNQQQRAMSYLRNQAQRGRATKPQPFWLRNAISVTATPKTVRELAALENVESIVYDRKVTALDGDQPRAITTFAKSLDEYGNLTAPTGFEHAKSGARAWHVDYIGADDVQERGVTGQGINVSVVDTGVDATHPALQGQVKRWKDFTADNYTTPRDPIGHGTHVAALVAGNPDAKHAVGVAPGADVFGAKVFSKNGGGRLSDLLNAFEWSANNSADVISASIGMPPITDINRGTSRIQSSETSKTNVTVYHDASEYINNSSSVSKAYKPASALVLVEPTGVNGTQIETSTVQEQVMQNLSVSFVSPKGRTPLKRVEAGWAFSDGSVPEEIGLYKFKPNESTPIQAAGNWSLQVSNANANNVTFNYTVAPVYPTNGSDQLSEAVNTLATTEDIVPVIAAGNFGSIYGNRTISSPGAAEKAITVGASGYRTNDVTEFSSRGPVDYGTETRPGIDVIAPGMGVLSAYPTELTPSGEQPYARMAGTSMATPQVSGAVALLLAANPNMTRTDVATTLRKTAQPVPGGAAATGAGLVDAWTAVNQTAPDALSAPSTESGIRELYAGVANTSETYVRSELGPATDPAGDAGAAPDLRASNRIISDELELVSHNSTPKEGTFRVYIDVDKNDSSGDTTQNGSEYRIVLNRTFTNGTYSLATKTQEYNDTTTAYEPTQNISTYGNEDQTQGDFVGLWGIHFQNRDEPVQFDWHVTSAPIGGDAADRLPNTGQVASGGINESIKGVAVAWNASAGQPIADAPVTFKVYDWETGSLTATETVNTSSDGRAVATLPVTVNRSFHDFTLEITDPYNNTITQSYTVADSCVECLVDPSEAGGMTVVDRGYTAKQNETVRLTIPIYNSSNNQMDPYTGPVSFRLSHYSVDSPIVKNNLTAENGIVTATINLSNTTIDENDDYIDVQASLTSTFNQSLSTSAGDIRIQRSAARVTTSPRATVTAPGQSVSLSFQSVDRQTQKPVNETVAYKTVWITDRHVASLYEQLPTQTVRDLKKIRRAALFDEQTTTRLTSEDKQALKRALTNLSKTQGTNRVTTTGTATPTAHGVGTLRVTPVDDSRFGLVMAASEGQTEQFVDSVVFVDSRVDKYRNKQTEPTESSRYDLRIHSDWDDWGTHREGDYIVPNSTYDVQVSLYDQQTDSLVENATIDLYSVTGAHVQVTTNGSHPVTATLPAPDVDWPNASYGVREQQVLGIAQGYTTASGEALADREHLYGDVDRVTSETDSGLHPHPSVSYENETLTAQIDYVNSTGEPVNGTQTLVMLGSPDAWFDIKRDYLATFVNASNQTSYQLNVTDPMPPGPAEPRQYEVAVRHRTGSEDTMWVDHAWVNEGQVTVNAPSTVYSGEPANVTLTLRGRDGEPIPGAALVWTHHLHTSTETSVDSGSHVGVTDGNGQVTFTISPTLPSDAESAYLTYRLGYATSNASLDSVEYGSLQVQQTQPVTISGELAHATENLTGNNTVIAANSEVLGGDITNSTGHYSITSKAGVTQDVEFYQGNYSATQVDIPVRDGVPDLYGITTLTPSADVDLNRTTLPSASVLNVTVVDEHDKSVPGATVSVTHVAENGTNAALRGLQTNANGMLQLDGATHPGVEVNGTVVLTVTPPDTNAYVDTTYTRQLRVENATNETIVVEENLTVSGTVRKPNDEPAAQDELILYGNQSHVGTTDANGTFSVSVNGSTVYDVGYYQHGTPLDDSTPDIETLAPINVSTTSKDIGNLTLPMAYDLNVTVVNESNTTVAGATVKLVDWAGAHYQSSGFGTGYHETMTDGAFNLSYASQPGIDAAGNVTVIVKPPANDTYVNATYTENLTVDKAIETNITLQEATSDGGSDDDSGSANLAIVRTDINETSIVTGSAVNISATVENTGNESGSMDVSFRQDGEPLYHETVTVKANAKKTVSFEEVYETPGTYNLSVNGEIISTLDVKPVVSVTNTTLTDTTITAGSSVTINATIANNGSASESLNVTLYVDGAPAATQSVTVNASSTKTVSFKRPFDEPGTYNLSVNDEELPPLTVQEPETTPSETPGFGAGAAIIGLLGGTLLLRRH